MPIPVIETTERTLSKAWEESVRKCWYDGAKIKTEYDKVEDPPSRDCIAVINVLEPLAEPRIHRSMPGGLDDLWKYVEEVVYGVHDHWIAPEEGKWSYTYHKRFRYYMNGAGVRTDQVSEVVNKLLEAPHTRRAQMITWQPWVDAKDEHAPCLQRMWFRIYDGLLHCNVHIRSNDAYKAGFMNMYAFVELQKFVASCYNARCLPGKECGIGPYTHFADSYHIYGSYFPDFANGFLKMLQVRTFEERTWTEEFAAPLFEEAKEVLRGERAREELELYKAGKLLKTCKEIVEDVN